MWSWVEETVGNRGKVVSYSTTIHAAENGWKQIKGEWTLQDFLNISKSINKALIYNISKIHIALHQENLFMFHFNLLNLNEKQ